jgi:hypothetical protein
VTHLFTEGSSSAAMNGENADASEHAGTWGRASSFHNRCAGTIGVHFPEIQSPRVGVVSGPEDWASVLMVMWLFRKRRGTRAAQIVADSRKRCSTSGPPLRGVSVSTFSIGSASCCSIVQPWCAFETKGPTKADSGTCRPCACLVLLMPSSLPSHPIHPRGCVLFRIPCLPSLL